MLITGLFIEVQNYKKICSNRKGLAEIYQENSNFRQTAPSPLGLHQGFAVIHLQAICCLISPLNQAAYVSHLNTVSPENMSCWSHVQFYFKRSSDVTCVGVKDTADVFSLTPVTCFPFARWQAVNTGCLSCLSLQNQHTPFSWA